MVLSGGDWEIKGRKGGDVGAGMLTPVPPPQTMLFTTCMRCPITPEPLWEATIQPTAEVRSRANGTLSTTPGERMGFRQGSRTDRRPPHKASILNGQKVRAKSPIIQLCVLPFLGLSETGMVAHTVTKCLRREGKRVRISRSSSAT